MNQDLAQCKIIIRKCAEAIADFLVTVDSNSDNYVEGNERIQLEDALRQCLEVLKNESLR